MFLSRYSQRAFFLIWLVVVLAGPSISCTPNPSASELTRESPDYAYDAHSVQNKDSMLTVLLDLQVQKPSVRISRALAILYSRKKDRAKADSLYSRLFGAVTGRGDEYHLLEDYVQHWLYQEDPDSALRYINLAYVLSQELSGDWYSLYMKYQNSHVAYSLMKKCDVAMSYLDSIDSMKIDMDVFRISNAENRQRLLQECKPPG